MSRSYTVEEADGITRIRLLRSLDLEGTVEVIDEVAETGVSDRRIWYLTENFSFTAEEIKNIAARGRVHWPSAARVAYLAADDLTFGLLRMFEVFREQENYQTRVFREEQEALEWLQEWSGSDSGGHPDRAGA